MGTARALPPLHIAQPLRLRRTVTVTSVVSLLFVSVGVPVR